MNDSAGAAPGAASRSAETSGSHEPEPELSIEDKRNGTASPAQYASVHWDSYAHDHDHDRNAARARAKAGPSRVAVKSAPPAAISFSRANGNLSSHLSSDDSDGMEEEQPGSSLEPQLDFVPRPARHSWDVKGKGKALEIEVVDVKSNGAAKARPLSMHSMPSGLPRESADAHEAYPPDLSDPHKYDRDGNSIHSDRPPRRKKRSNTWTPSGLGLIRTGLESSPSESDEPYREHLRRSYSSYSTRRTRTPSPVQQKRDKRAHMPRSASEFLPSSASGPTSSSQSRRHTPRSASPMAFADLRPRSAEIKGHELPFSRPSSSSNLSNLDMPQRPSPLRKRTSGLHMRVRSGSRSTHGSRQVSDVQVPREMTPRKRAKSNLSVMTSVPAGSPQQPSPIRQIKARTFSNDDPRRRQSSVSKIAFPALNGAVLSEEPLSIEENVAPAPASPAVEPAYALPSSRSRPFSIAGLMQEGALSSGQGVTPFNREALLDIIKGVDLKDAQAYVKQNQAQTAEANAQHARQASTPSQQSEPPVVNERSPVATDSAWRDGSKSRMSSQPSTNSMRETGTVSARAPLLAKSPTMSDASAIRRGSLVIRETDRVSQPVPAHKPSVAEQRKKRRLSNLFGTPGKKDKGKQRGEKEEQLEVDTAPLQEDFDMRRITPQIESTAADIKTEFENYYSTFYSAIAQGKPPPNVAEIARWRYRRHEIVMRRRGLTGSQTSADLSTSRRSLNKFSVNGSVTVIDRFRGRGPGQARWSVGVGDITTFLETKGSLWEGLGTTKAEPLDPLRQAVGPSAGASRRPPYHHYASSDISLRSLESIHEGHPLGVSRDRTYGQPYGRHLRGSQDDSARSPASERANPSEALGLANMPITPKSAASPYSSQHGHTSSHLSPSSSIRRNGVLHASPEQHNAHSDSTGFSPRAAGLSPSSSRGKRLRDSVAVHNARLQNLPDKAIAGSASHGRLDLAFSASPTSGPSDSEPLAPQRSRTDPRPTLSRATSLSSSMANLSKILPGRKLGKSGAETDGYKSVDDGDTTDRSFTTRFRKPPWRASLPPMTATAGTKAHTQGHGRSIGPTVAADAVVRKPVYDVFADLKPAKEPAIVDLDEESHADIQSFLSTLRVAIQGPGAPARYASCRQFRDEFHTLNIERSRLGQLARLDIAEPSFLKEDFAAVDSGKQVSPRIRQSSSIDGEVDDPDVTVIGSDARFLEGEVDERPRHDRLTSYPDSLTEQMCKALGEEDEHEAELQRSHTRRRTPHMDEVSKKLEKNRSRLRKAAQDVEDGCNLLKEVHDAVQKTKDRVGQYANVMSKELNNRGTQVGNLIREIADESRGIKPYTPLDYLKDLGAQVAPNLLTSVRVVLALWKYVLAALLAIFVAGLFDPGRPAIFTGWHAALCWIPAVFMLGFHRVLGAIVGVATHAAGLLEWDVAIRFLRMIRPMTR